MTPFEFIDVFWSHYLLLEADFLETRRYLQFDKDNKDAFSNEYLKQYQAIGSEIDVFAKEFCKLLDPNFKGSNINHYCKCITDNVDDFTNEEIYVMFLEEYIQPWKDWTYTVSIDKLGREKINSNVPKWWTMYNKTKHQRTTALVSYNNKPFYKFANQNNLISALGGLFLLEMHCFIHLLKNSTRISDSDYVIGGSKLFIMKSLTVEMQRENYSLYKHKEVSLAVID